MIWAISGAVLGAVLIVIFLKVRGDFRLDTLIGAGLFCGTVGFLIGAFFGGVPMKPAAGTVGGFFTGLCGGAIVFIGVYLMAECQSGPAWEKVAKLLHRALVPLVLLSACGGAYWGYVWVMEHPLEQKQRMMTWAGSGAAVGMVLGMAIAEVLRRGTVVLMFIGATSGSAIGARLGEMQMGHLADAIEGFFTGLIIGGLVFFGVLCIVTFLAGPFSNKVEKIMNWVFGLFILLSAVGGAYWEYRLFS